ncbi:MAG: preprotein translocase subunit SecD, partial [Maricaulis maris]
MLHFGRWKLLSIFLITLLGVMYTIPNFVPEEDRFTINEVDGTATPKGIWRFIPAGTINLGLDLQGGSHIVFEVDMDEVRDAQLETLASDIRTTLRDAPPVLARSVAVIGDEVVVLLVRPEERDIALERIRELNAPVTTGIGQVGLSNMYDIGADPSDPSAIRISVTSQQY